MRFYLRKRRHPPAVIIVALIDILIVLLIFLMVTTTFTQQPAVKLALPESSSALKSGAEESPPLVVAIDAHGNFHLGPEGRQVTADQLRAGLASALARNPNLKLAISADKAAPLGQVVKVWDAAKESNIRDKVVSLFVKQAAK